ncbi:MAG TPA: hypothetical protein VM915_17470 [Verrucomicrobiae bacterium]|jgi:hypothetical protein|nr:hypothetical protein [Verrucomicrobiae bacterium]
MIYSTITFRRPGLQDSAQSESDDAITGLRRATWISSHLHDFNATKFDKEPIAEDWGYAVRVFVGTDTLLLGFSSAFEDDPDRWRLVISDNFNRGLLPQTQKRRQAELVRLSDFVKRVLVDSDGVSDVQIELRS